MVSSLEAIDSNFEKPQNVITIPYTPRGHFRSLHQSPKRWKFVVAHRRAGKTVALVNQLIRAAITNIRQTPPPRYAYIGPSFQQTKDLAWGYLKFYTAAIPGMVYSESELTALFPNGAKITLYGGAAAYERMRGLYFDGAVMDEFALLNPDAWESVVRPCLADYRGFAIVSGTSNGDDHFNELRMTKVLTDLENWDYFDIKVTMTDALHPDEVDEMQTSMSKYRFAREMMNSFDAPVEGAYFGELMAEADQDGRICKVPHDPKFPVIAWWDLGIRDTNSIWFVQKVGRAIHVIDYMGVTGKGFPWYATGPSGGAPVQVQLPDVRDAPRHYGSRAWFRAVPLRNRPRPGVGYHGQPEDGPAARHRGCARPSPGLLLRH
jgi:phage terminase large subunit